MQRQLQWSIHPSKPGIQLLGLRNRPWESIKDKPTFAFGAAKLVGDRIDDEVVRDQVTTFHDRFDLPAKFGFLRHCPAQDLATRDLWYAVLLGHEPGLGPFPGTGCSQQHNSHHSTLISVIL